MRTTIAAALTALLLAAPANAADQPVQTIGDAVRALELSDEKLALAREVIATIIPPDRRLDVLGGAAKAMVGQLRGVDFPGASDPGLQAIVSRHLDRMPALMMPILERHAPDLVEAMARAYAREFSLDELRDIRAFAASPAGNHYLSRSTALLADPDVAAANQAYMAEIVAALPPLQEALRADILKYLASHPPKGKP